MKIPPRVKIKAKVSYEVLFTDAFNDPSVLGECRFTERQIVIRNGQSDTQLLKTFFHEVLHAICEERKIEISHKSVYALEHAFYYLLKSNQWN